MALAIQYSIFYIQYFLQLCDAYSWRMPTA